MEIPSKLLAAAAAVAVLTALHPAHADERPTALPLVSGCSLWTGTASGGNDPSVQIHVRLCANEGGRVHGLYQWSSLISGWNLRELRGRQRSDGVLELSDVRIIDERPQPNWRFCLSERYVLTPESASVLVGHYENAGCNDRAQLRLEADPTDTEATAAREASTHPVVGMLPVGEVPPSSGLPDAPAPPTPPGSPHGVPAAASEAGCGCRTIRTGATSLEPGLFGLLWALRLRRRRD